VAVIIRDAELAADFVASWASFYQQETTRPGWKRSRTSARMSRP
jgi:hypothetical protein